MTTNESQGYLKERQKKANENQYFAIEAPRISYLKVIKTSLKENQRKSKGILEEVLRNSQDPEESKGKPRKSKEVKGNTSKSK